MKHGKRHRADTETHLEIDSYRSSILAVLRFPFNGQARYDVDFLLLADGESLGGGDGQRGAHLTNMTRCEWSWHFVGPGQVLQSILDACRRVYVSDSLSSALGGKRVCFRLIVIGPDHTVNNGAHLELERRDWSKAVVNEDGKT